VFSLGGLNTTTVTSGSTETGSLNVAMSASIQNTLDVTGMANFGQSVSIGGNLSLNGALVLASKTSAPASLAGSMYYDSSANKFKCYTTSWVDCDTTGGGGGGTVVMRYVPEFGGAVLSADGSSNSGTLTAGFVNGVGGTQGYKHNYYQWSTAQGTPQDYDIILNVQIPSNYTAIGAASTFKLWIQDPDSGTTNAQVTWTILDEDETSCFSSNFNGSTTNWEQKTASTLGSCSFAANDTKTVKFHVSTTSTAGNLKLGEFQFSYTN
jgi:hypothetical protein